jgi:excisionase family DNA binding protein
MSEASRSNTESRGVLLDVRGAASYLGTTPRHVRRLVEERRISFVKLGDGRSSPLRFDTARLDEWIEAHTVEPERDA